MITKKGITVSIFAFLTFLSIMSSVGIIVLMIDVGPGSTVSPYILSSIAGAQPIETYLFMSLVASAIWLAITCIIIYQKQPPDPQIFQLLLNITSNLSSLKQSQENTEIELSKGLENNKIRLPFSV